MAQRSAGLPLQHDEAEAAAARWSCNSVPIAVSCLKCFGDCDQLQQRDSVSSDDQLWANELAHAIDCGLLHRVSSSLIRLVLVRLSSPADCHPVARSHGDPEHTLGATCSFHL